MFKTSVNKSLHWYLKSFIIELYSVTFNKCLNSARMPTYFLGSNFLSSEVSKSYNSKNNERKKSYPSTMSISIFNNASMHLKHFVNLLIAA